jgi:hypothetical protein
MRDVYIFISVRTYTCMQEHRGSCVYCLRKRERKSLVPAGALSHTITASSLLIMDRVGWAQRHILLLTVSGWLFSVFT